MKTQTALCLTIVSVISFSAEASAARRCIAPSKDEAKQIRRYGILRICRPLTVRLDSNIVELPADLIADAMAPAGVVLRKPGKNGNVVFNASKSPSHKSYVVCNASRRAYSNIPGLGKYVKHGIRALTPTAVTYGWQLKRRRYHNVRFVYDVTVSFVPERSLIAARRAGACSTDQQVREALRWLT